MFSYRRWFPRVLVIDGITIAPAFVLGGYRHPQHQKRHEQFALQAWESEGGNPAALHLASQAYSSGQALGENLVQVHQPKQEQVDEATKRGERVD